MDTITRSQLVEIADWTIDLAGLEPDVAAELREIARTVPEITGDWLAANTECGCLVGWMWLRMPTAERPHLPRDLNETRCNARVGLEFLDALKEAGFYSRNDWLCDTPIKVVDDEQEGVSGMDIGKEERTIIVEPMETPVPTKEPVPAKEPARRPAPAPEKVPSK